MMYNLMRIMVMVSLIFFCLSPYHLVFSDPFVEEDQFGAFDIYSSNLADVDGDGDLDASITCCNCDSEDNNGLFINDGSGVFTLREGEFQVPTGYDIIATGFADVDSDGDLDAGMIERGSPYNSSRLYFNDGDGFFSFEECFGYGFSESIAYADADLDGDIDAAVVNMDDDNPNLLFINDGSGNFTPRIEFNTQGEGTYLGRWGDFNGDGYPDFIAAAQTIRVFWNDGDANFTEEVITDYLEVATESLEVGDVDNDGDLDIGEVHINDDYTDRLLRNDGEGNFTIEDAFGDTDNGYTMVFVDIDHDGDEDALVGQKEGISFIYRNDGTGYFTEEVEFCEDVISFATGDVDGDGDIDVVAGTSEYSSQQINRLYRNQQNDDNWIIVELTGKYYQHGSHYSNRDAIGAKVYIFEDGYLGDLNHLLGLNEVSAESGHMGQDDLAVHFGVPEGEYVDVRIEWPGSDGQHFKQDIEDLAVGQKHYIEEEGELIPNEILLTHFSSISEEGSIRLNWSVETTEGEKNEGFNIFRRFTSRLNIADKSIWTQINDALITGDNPYTYIDDSVESGVTYEYELEAIVRDRPETLGTTTGVCGVPTSFEITNIYPNPSTDRTTVHLSIPEDTSVVLTIYDIKGRTVWSRQVEDVSEGEFTGRIDTDGLSNGLYILMATTTEGGTSTRKLVVSR